MTRSSERSLASTATALFASSILCACASNARKPETSTLPAARLATAPAGEHDLHELTAGHVVVLDLWSTWCDACRIAIPRLVKLSTTYANAGLVVIGVDVGDDAAEVRAFAEREGITYPVLLDPDFRFADAVGSRRVPTVIVADRAGVIVWRGDALDDAAMAQLRRLLDVR